MMADQSSAPYDTGLPVPALNGAAMDVEMKDESAPEVTTTLRMPLEPMLTCVPPAASILNTCCASKSSDKPIAYAGREGITTSSSHSTA